MRSYLIFRQYSPEQLAFFVAFTKITLNIPKCLFPPLLALGFALPVSSASALQETMCSFSKELATGGES